MHFVVDRIEENIAVIELPSGELINVPIKLFPISLKEGKKYNIELSEIESNDSLKQKFDSLFK